MGPPVAAMPTADSERCYTAAFHPVRVRTFTPILQSITEALVAGLPGGPAAKQSGAPAPCCLTLSPLTALPPPSPAALDHRP